jgi:hypothetical protein
MVNEVFWIPIVAMVGSFSMVVAIIWLVSRGRLRRAQYRVDVQTKLIDKFGSAPEFVTFLQSPAGQKFVGDLDSAPKKSVHERILGATTGAAVLVCLGMAFILVHVFHVEEDPGIMVPGFILVGIGVGLIVAAVISTRLSRSWGLLPQAGSGRDE